MEQLAIFEEKVYLTPQDLNRIGTESIDSLLKTKLQDRLENKCHHHGFVLPKSLELLSRSMGHLENGRYTGNVLYYVQAQGKVYCPHNGTVISGTVIKKNKMGLYIIYKNAIRILVPRDLHISDAEKAKVYESIQVGNTITIELRKSRFQINDPFILSVGVFQGFTSKEANVAPPPSESTDTESVSVSVSPVKPTTPAASAPEVGFKITKIPLPFSELSEMPKSKKTLILVPFRDTPGQGRKAQLDAFIDYFTPRTQTNDLNVVILEQDGQTQRFNRGALLNVGIQMAKKQGYDTVILHDVDLLPSEALLPYYFVKPTKPIHLASLWKKYPGEQFLGGVLSVSVEDLEKANGFPNNFWGWGGEDDALKRRLARKGITSVYAPVLPEGIEAFKELPHPLTQSTAAWVNPRKREKLEANTGESGLSDISYTIQNDETIEFGIRQVTILLPTTGDPDEAQPPIAPAPVADNVISSSEAENADDASVDSDETPIDY